MAGKMEVFTLLLMFFTLPGYSYVLQPKSTVAQISGLDRHYQTDFTDVFITEEKENGENTAVESTERTEDEHRSERENPETHPEREHNKTDMTVEEREDELNIEEEILDRNHGYEKGREDRKTPETFSETIILQEGKKREGYSIVDAVEDSDTKVVVEKREEGLNLSYKTRAQDEASDIIFKKKYQMEKLRQEERESELVAGINLQEQTNRETHEHDMILTLKEEVAEKGGKEDGEERAGKEEDIKNAKHNELERAEGHIRVPNLSTSSAQVGKESEIPAAIIITQSQSPPPHHHHQNVPPPFPASPTQVLPPSSVPPTANTEVDPQFFPLAVTNANPTVSTAVPGEVRSVSLLDELLIEVLQSPGHHLKQNQLEVKSGPNLENEMEENIWLQPAQRELLQTTHKAQEINTVVQPKSEFTSNIQAATPKPKDAAFITKDLNTTEPNPTPNANENISTAKSVGLTRKPNMTQPTSKPRTIKPAENDTKLEAKQNKASRSQPQLTKPSSKPQLTTAKTPSTRPRKINSSRKNKTIRKTVEKKRKKDNKTQKPSERTKEVTTPTHFPYFMDNYCPPECACYGRVVQCSDKGVDKVPYGIPYNARYILLMNNHINSIQLDLLNEYVSMEFLVLSNNQLTDGAIEGAFEGIPALKRLYLDRNQLESIPTDLPFSLEELRLDNNRLGVMSEAAWACCPSLLILSLSNNSLGNGSDSLPNAVFSPLFNLRTLNLDHNQLTSVPLGLPLSIKELYLKGNFIEQFRERVFNGISELVVLDLSENKLTNKGLLRESLLNATHLESLNLEGNRLKQVPRHLPRSLKTLNLQGNLISAIKKAAFTTLKNLEHLGLARNKIYKVAPGAFRTLLALHQLDLCHNTLRQVPRQLPQDLHSVALTHNRIQSVPRDAFCWGNKSLALSRLVQIQLEHNLIDMGKLDTLAFRCLRGFQVVHFY